jgi:hypothetical protein
MLSSPVIEREIGSPKPREVYAPVHPAAWDESPISGESALKKFGESTAVAAKPHESPYPEPEGRRIEVG